MRCQSGSRGFDSTQSTISAPVYCLVMVKSRRRQAGGFTSHLTHCGSSRQKHLQLLWAGSWVSLVIFRVRGLQNRERQIKSEENRDREWEKKDSNNHSYYMSHTKPMPLRADKCTFENAWDVSVIPSNLVEIQTAVSDMSWLVSRQTSQKKESAVNLQTNHGWRLVRAIKPSVWCHRVTGKANKTGRLSLRSNTTPWMLIQCPISRMALMRSQWLLVADRMWTAASAVKCFVL